MFALAGVTCLKFSPEARAAAAVDFQPFSFAYITDAHLATGTPDTFILMQESQLFLQDVIKQLSSEKLDFVIFGGDQVERPGPEDANWQLFLDIAQSLPCPWNFVLGERDISGPPAVDKMRTFGPDWKGKGIESGKPWWSMDPLANVHLIGLDTSKVNSITGEISKEQLIWLKNDLLKNAHKFTIVFSHHPLLPPAPFDGGGAWDDYIVPDGASAREILGGSKYVRLAVSGHVHVSRIEPERDVWYVSSPSLAVYPCAYRIFHVTPDEITVETYQISFPALIKKARGLLDQSNLAFKYNEQHPQTFADLAAGGRLDQNSIMQLIPNGGLLPLNAKKKRKVKEERPAPPKKEEKPLPKKETKAEPEKKESKKTPPPREKPDNKRNSKEKQAESEKKDTEKPTTDLPRIDADQLNPPATDSDAPAVEKESAPPVKNEAMPAPKKDSDEQKSDD